MKCLIVYRAGDRWFGSQVEWRRSGSGHFREISGVEIPQTKSGIDQFAKENGYSIEWRGSVPAEEAPQATSRAS